MEDLPVEVQVVRAHFIPALPCVSSDLLVSEDTTQGRHVSRSLIAVVSFRFSVKDAEEIVVRSSDDFTDGGKKLRKKKSVVANNKSYLHLL